MKKIILGLAIVATTLAACNNGNNKTPDNVKSDANSDTSVVGTENADKDTTQAQQTATASANNSPAKEIIANYLQLKNALGKDNGNDAAAAGNKLVATLATVDMKTMPGAQMKSYMEIADDIKEHSEHIGANAGKIAHQREHFIMLSKDMADLVKTFGNGGQTLYKDFCPMANEGKGATWISEVKEIKNPYLGSKMPTCGTVQETIK